MKSFPYTTGGVKNFVPQETWKAKGENYVCIHVLIKGSQKSVNNCLLVILSWRLDPFSLTTADTV